ncbi:MAG: hypothetical protein IT385_15350 [Deltaproteobacteria bacterium]|nr:hypothetical protein [Deltaproteobacteria bacterium]
MRILVIAWVGASACDATPADPAGVPDAAVTLVDTASETTSATEVVAAEVVVTDALPADVPSSDGGPEVEVEVEGPPGCDADTPCDPGLVCVEGECACDETPVSFVDQIQPLFTTGCGPGCHVYSSATSGSAGLNLHKSHAFADLVGVPAYQCSGDAARARVSPGDVGGSYLMDKLIGRDMCRGIRMPKGRSPWSADKLALVGRWICQGARND